MAKERGDVTFVQVSMYYPVTDAAMDTDSYDRFADRLLPEPRRRWSGSGTPTPPIAPGAPRSRPRRTRRRVEQVRGLPPTLLMVDEADVLRDEGEAYAAKLRSAGVPVTTVRYDGTVHDFMLLNSLTDTRATRASVAQATAFLRAALGTA